MTHNDPSSRTDISTDQGLNVQHSACEVCRAKKLKCTGQRPCCKRCILKNLSCQYPPPEGRKRKPQAEDAVASRQAASAARSRRVNGVIPHELQGVFTVHMTDVTQPRAQSPISTNTRAIQAAVSSPHAPEDLRLDNQRFFTVEDSDLGVERSTNESGSVGGAGLSHEDLIDGSTVLEWATTDLTASGDMSPMSFDFDLGAFSPISPYFTRSKSPEQSCQIQQQQQPITPTLESTDGMSRQLEKPSSSSQRQCSNSASQSHNHTSQRKGSMCHCFEAASTLLERWEARKNDSLDGLLKFYKATVYQLGSFLACQRCSTLSAFMMLPLVLCEKLISASPLILEYCSHTDGRGCQESCKRTTGPQPTMTSPNNFSSSPEVELPDLRAGISEPAGRKTRMSFGEYDIESQQEWQSVSEVLILFQLTQLGTLLERYKSIAASLGWHTQLALVVDLQKRLHGATQSRHTSLEKSIKASGRSLP